VTNDELVDHLEAVIRQRVADKQNLIVSSS